MHLFEFEDQSWFPHALRNYLTDVVQFISRRAVERSPVLEVLARLLDQAGADTIVDLCSGSSGPLPVLRERLEARRRAVSVVLTDKYPHLAAYRAAEARSAGRVRYRSQAVDATAVPPDLAGVRTLFTSLHHFRPDQVRAILADAVRQRRGIGVFEGTERSFRALVMTAVMAPLFALGAALAIRPFRWGRLFWTYLFPVIPLVTLWDGLVSCLRTYSLDELRDLAGSVVAPDYVWETGSAPIRSTPVLMTYLLGYPVPAGTTAREAQRGPQGDFALVPAAAAAER